MSDYGWLLMLLPALILGYGIGILHERSRGEPTETGLWYRLPHGAMLTKVRWED